MRFTSSSLKIPVVMAVVLGLGEIASASTTIVHCAGSESTITYTPALTNYQQQVVVTVTGKLSSCDTSDPNIKISEGTYDESFKAALSCANFLSTEGVEMKIKWNNGDTSTLSLISNLKSAEGKIADSLSGSVTSGTFQGNSVTGNMDFEAPDAVQCSQSGVTKMQSRYGTFSIDLPS
ncbi:hypothetical protein BGX28_002536 [Mortierella sp. GBA30]|nr:hypothetical protein BGX28_002536 [Mortierella sp. GBA30]